MCLTLHSDFDDARINQSIISKNNKIFKIHIDYKSFHILKLLFGILKLITLPVYLLALDTTPKLLDCVVIILEN